jgi:hypothetical protein
MSTIESQPNTSNLQTLETEVSLTKQELEDFKKLPKEQQEKQKQDKLAKLSDLQNKLDKSIQEAIKTGKLKEAKKLEKQLKKEVQDLEQQVEVTKFLKGAERSGTYEEQAKEDYIELEKLQSKITAKQSFNEDDLIFLYEINNTIKCPNYIRDPRIEKFRKQRNPEEDLLILFNQDQIARTSDKINQKTKIYIGSLQPGIFDTFKKQSIDYIYTSFPFGRIKQFNIEVGVNGRYQLEDELKKYKISVSDVAKGMIEEGQYTFYEEKDNIELVQLTVKDLGFSGGATTGQIYKKVQELGLKLCLAEAGPVLRLKYKDQPIDEDIHIAREPVNRSGRLHLDGFLLNRLGVDSGIYQGLWLRDYWQNPDSKFDPDDKLVFCKPKV